MDNQEFRKYAHQVADWMADYIENVEELPVKSLVKPGEIFGQIPASPPKKSESMETIIDDVNRIILPGITQWQSPNFFAYFPANSSYPSVLAEMMTATMGAQCMVWETSPAAAELEEKVMCWLKEMTGIPAEFEGVIQDSASTSTLVAILSAREKYSSFAINEKGIQSANFRIYCSSEAHSSVEKAVKISGIGSENLRKIAIDEALALNPLKLEEIIKQDIKAGLIPICVVAAVGATGTCAMDPVKEISAICRKYNIWLHIDAAYAGSAMVLPEHRYLIEGIENADSYVFNPHKWLFTNFDCSAYFVRDKETLIKTFEILPEYLKTRPDSIVNNYRDWGVQLGRRFRALKLWFVIREMGTEEIKTKISNHILWANELALQIKQSKEFRLFEPQHLALICFSFCPDGMNEIPKINALNLNFLHHLNSSGKLYLSHTKIRGQVYLRMQIGQTSVSREHVQKAWSFIQTESVKYMESYGTLEPK